MMIKKTGGNKNLREIHTAARVSWLVTMVGLLIWSLVEFFARGELGVPFILLSLGLAVFFGSLLIIRNINRTAGE
jgi:hypothetical protein